MLPRTITAPTLLVASIGVPYVASNAPEWTRQVRDAATAAPPAAAAGDPAAAPVATPAKTAVALAPPSPSGSVFPNVTPLEGLPTYSLADVLRMDVSKEWVYQRWPRKSTALAELDLYGVRVPLVTGTQLHDLAGSLTYFFGADGRVRRIAFHGLTGDTTQVAMLVHQRFGLAAHPTATTGEQLLQFRQGDDVISELRTRPAPVLWATKPHESFAVDLVLQDPATARPIAPGELTSAPASPAAPAANAAPPPAAQTAAAPASAAPAQAAEPAPPPEEPLGWKALFPRARVPESQMRSLEQGNLYQ